MKIYSEVTMPQAAIILTTVGVVLKHQNNVCCHNAASGNHSYDFVNTYDFQGNNKRHNAASGNHSYDLLLYYPMLKN